VKNKKKFLSQYTDLMKEWDYGKNKDLDPEKITYGSGKKVGWICKKCIYKWEAIVNSRTNGQGCPACCGHKIKLDGSNSLAYCHPELLLEWDYEKNKELGFDPKKITYGSHKKVFWICKKCGYKWEATINKRTMGRNCPACAGHKIKLDDSNSLAYCYPELLLEWNYKKNKDLGFDPKKVTCKTNKKVFWKCKKCGYERKTSISSRTNGNGCLSCAGQVIKPDGSNSLSTMFPKLLKEWNSEKNKDLDPKRITSKNNKKVWWICKKCEYEWEATISNRTKGSGCPSCAGQVVRKNGSNSLAYCHPELLLEWDYEKNNKLGLYPKKIISGSHKKTFWICKKCKYEWKASIGSRTDKNIKTGCPKCNESKGEKKIGKWFKNNKIEFHSQYKFNDCKNKRKLPFDFFLPKYNILIEYQGRQHYQSVDFFGGEEEFIKRQKLDKIKEKYAKDNNIKLIIISHWEKDNIEQILNKEILIKIK